ncbi:MAG: 8-oxoguanine DNA glycosylase [Methanobacteriota archaeon]|nr:MAG: 8-oxoguanine DNA glycosylase [Euryarchaeota archaeon]
MHELVLSTGEPLNLYHTLSCGQAFRWAYDKSWWTGVVGDRVIRCRQDGCHLFYTGTTEAEILDYFAIDLDLPKILASIEKDRLIADAILRCRGLRILRQPADECLFSYILATCSNIPMIKRRIALLAACAGKEIVTPDGAYHAFPTAEAIAAMDEDCLRGCKLGYRAAYIKETAEIIAANPGWAGRIASLSTDEARDVLQEFRGIGPKAADCILLFAFARYDAFPVDVWIRRIMLRHYLHENEVRSFSPSEYDRIRHFARGYFGPYAGYAQEYLYCIRADEPSLPTCRGPSSADRRPVPR